MWTNFLVIAGGGALGAVLRYGVAVTLPARSFPWATLTVNTIGSLLFGFLAIWLTERFPGAAGLRAFALVGVLGAFTTFSTFSFETMTLMQAGDFTRAGVNVVASVALCLLAVAAGMALARQLV